VLRQIKLLVFDLDYLLFDCGALKIKALRESLLQFAELIPQDARLPDDIDVEEGYQKYGFRWTRYLELGFGDEELAELENRYRVQERQLATAGIGGLYPGIPESLQRLRAMQLELALGVEATREYLLAVSDRHGLDRLFHTAFCTEEFGMGGADEMLEEIMCRAEVNPSETIALGTRPDFFLAARNLDIRTIGCGWGLRDTQVLNAADLQSAISFSVTAAVEEADRMAGGTLTD
jgi:phosphoglycolate phosphatase-like HAD superfamily hydrolase